ncbi:MAG: Mu transposase C-terminal domain-containing protein [Candidatus Neomarinimicrobiota bacterium]
MKKMDVLYLTSGREFLYKEKLCRLKKPLSLDKVLVEIISTGEDKAVEIKSLQYPDQQSCPNEKKHIKATDAQLIDDDIWACAQERKTVIDHLLKQGKYSKKQVIIAAKELGVRWRQMYNLLKLYQENNYSLSSLIPQKSSGGKQRSRLSGAVESIMQSTIEEMFLSSQRHRISKIIEEIKLRCHFAQLKVPGDVTIRRRIAKLDTKTIISKQHGIKIARAQFNYVNPTTEAAYPLETLQIDHTPVDLIIVDQQYRQPIGRPYLTLAIDVYSRCIAGFCLTLDPPCAVSVGLCLTHATFDKAEWLRNKGIETLWPIWGKPDHIFVDNGKEFHSEALKRGCDIHGIQLSYRPPGQPHYGGIVERVIGTFMQHVHEIPGTTFSNVKEKANYSSEKMACMTLSELENWLTIAITKYYHQKIHRSLNLPPIEKYKQGVLGNKEKSGHGYPPKLQNQRAFLIDFLPITRRTIQRYGFTLDHISYYCNTLAPFVANLDKHGKFIIRRDPRDLSHIYVQDPISKYYIEVPYRTLSRPTITLWEHRQALKRLKEKGAQCRFVWVISITFWAKTQLVFLIPSIHHHDNHMLASE